MKIAICKCGNGFEAGWVNKCERDQLEYIFINPYDNDIIHQLRVEGISHVLWHWHHSSPKDWLFARQLIVSMQQMGVKVFPDIRTCWHFDDKLGQKYILEASDLPIAQTWMFYSAEDAISWARQTTWPKVFKLRAGAGSKNVRLIRSYLQAQKYINKMFGAGFPSANVGAQLAITAKVVRNSPVAMIKRLYRLPHYIAGILARRTLPRQKGYCLFQEFIPGNLFDTRIIIIGKKAIGIRRKVRENDFRASGSGMLDYCPDKISLDCVRIAFEAAMKLRTQSLALDFVMAPDGTYRIIEISYAYTASAYYKCPGYWDAGLQWHLANVRPEEWIIDDLLSNDVLH